MSCFVSVRNPGCHPPQHLSFSKYFHCFLLLIFISEWMANIATFLPWETTQTHRENLNDNDELFLWFGTLHYLMGTLRVIIEYLRFISQSKYFIKPTYVRLFTELKVDSAQRSDVCRATWQGIFIYHAYLIETYETGRSHGSLYFNYLVLWRFD